MLGSAPVNDEEDTEQLTEVVEELLEEMVGLNVALVIIIPSPMMHDSASYKSGSEPWEILLPRRYGEMELE